ncbi:hypothetical protein ASD91_01990 [Pseudomonas sp. Root68]|nr:hypothetical protein ASD91_01990 [Pseudomonas sp. Root68]KRB65133.1 hypothetical protein ASD95_11145 [Pseudomonas sp. Root71]
MIGLGCLQYRALLIVGQKCGVVHITVSLLLRQQLVAVLDDGIAYLPLYLCAQAVFAVETLVLLLAWHHVTDQPVESIIMIMAQQSSLLGCHGMNTSEILSEGVQY